MKRKFVQVLAFMLAFILFISCPLSVYASEKWEGSLGLTLYYNKDKILQYIKDTGEFWLYGASQVGAIVQHDFVSFAENKKKMDDILSEGDKIGVYIDENNEAKGFFFSKEFMAELKALLDQYAKDNEPYYIIHIPSYKEVNPSQFATKGQYLTICNLAKKYGLIGVNGLYMSDLSEVLNGNYSYVNEIGTLTENMLLNDFYVALFDDAWDIYKGGQRYKFEFPAGTSVGYESIEDGIKTAYSNSNDFHSQFSPVYVTNHNGNILNHGTPIYAYQHIYSCLISRDGFSERIYKSLNDFKNYSVSKRKIYYTKDYYDYEPDDLSVSIDDMKKSIDDLQKIIDELLKKIDDLTSESDIEDILRQILEALRNQQSTGGGGSGGGDVTVNVDLSTTNNWLSKIYDKVSKIFEKVSTSATQSMSGVIESIENLKKLLEKYLKEISGDLDDIKGQLEEMSEKEFTEKTESFLDDTLADFSEIGEKAKGKFPFSIPNDIRLLISKMSVSPPEDPDQGTYSVQTMSFDADHESNGLVSVMDEGGGDTPALSETGAPIFYIPFVIASAGIDQYVVIDLSGFESISSFCRSLMTIFFIICLFNLTFKVMGLWGDLVD